MKWVDSIDVTCKEVGSQGDRRWKFGWKIEEDSLQKPE